MEMNGNRHRIPDMCVCRDVVRRRKGKNGQGGGYLGVWSFLPRDIFLCSVIFVREMLNGGNNYHKTALSIGVYIY